MKSDCVIRNLAVSQALSFAGRRALLCRGSVICTLLSLLAHPALASQQVISGKVLFTQGHVNPACRQVTVQDTTGTTYVFRIPTPSGPDSIGSAVLAAAISGQQVDVIFDTTVTTGCGTEPAISYVTVHGAP